MRVLALAVGALSIADLAIGVVVLSKPTSSSAYAQPTGPHLSRTIPPTPTRSFHTAANFERAESSPTVTAFTPSCSPGYTYLPTTAYSYTSCNHEGRSCIPYASWPTSSCIQTMCSSGSTPYLPIWTDTSCTEIATKPHEPVTTSCTDKATTGTLTCWYTSPNWGGTRSPRMVADFAARTSQDFGGRRSQRAVARFAEPTTSCTTTTDNKGGRSQRWVADFAEPTVTAKPEADQADDATPPFPTCSFDLDKGQYICPEQGQKTLPICSFNLSKGQYDCPTPAGGAASAEPTTLKTAEK